MNAKPSGQAGVDRNAGALRHAWVSAAVAIGLVAAGMLVVSTSDRGSVPALVGALVLLGTGVIGLVRALVFSGRAIRQGRAAAVVPLLLSASMMFFGVVAVLGAFGRFYGWDG